MFFNIGASLYQDSKVLQCQVRGQEQHSHGDGDWEDLGLLSWPFGTRSLLGLCSTAEPEALLNFHHPELWGLFTLLTYRTE